MFKNHDSGIITLSLCTAFTSLFFWRVIILLMRAKCAGPARVNTQLQCVCCTYRLQCTMYIKHIYFVHRFYIYQSITDYQYVQCIDYI